MTEPFIIEGNNINSISDFYTEMNSLLMKNEDWQLGESLDALDDVLYGGFGELKNVELPYFIWLNSEMSRSILGLDATKNYYLNKLEQPKVFNIKLFQEKLIDLENRNGETYFEILIEIFESHQNITLELR